MDNPALQQRGQLVRVVDYAGAAHSVRGVIALSDTTAGESRAAFAEAGALAWICFDSDPNQLEFCEYTDPNGNRIHRRVIRGERLGSLWNTCKLYLVSEATTIPAMAQFSRLDFDPRDFATD